MANFEAKEPCVICLKFGKGLVCYHHIWTRKAHPEYAMAKWNLFPCCFMCHQLMHSKPLSEIAEKNKDVKKWLMKNDWKFIANKWTRLFGGTET